MSTAKTGALRTLATMALLATGCLDDPRLGTVVAAPPGAPVFVSPQSGEVLTGRVPVTITPSQPDATAIRIVVDHSALGVATGAPWTVEIDTARLPDGVVLLEAIEEHEVGEDTTSQLAVLVDNESPSIEVVEPADGTVAYVENGTLRFAVRVGDDLGVARANLRLDGTSVASFAPPSREELSVDIDLAAWADAVGPGTSVPLHLEVEVEDETGHVASRAVDVAVGTRLRWRFDTVGRIETPALALPDGAVAVGSFDGRLYVVEADGTERCRVDSDEEVVGAPALMADGTGIVWGTTEHLRAVDAATCAARWTYGTVGVFRGGPTVAPDGTILAVEFSGTLHAVGSNGRSLWQAALGAEGIAAPAVGPDGTIAVGSLAGLLHVFGPDGSPRWTFETGGGIGAPALVTADAIYLGSYDFYVYALDLTGQPLWDYAFGTDADVQCSTGLLPNGGLAFCSRDGNVYSVDAATGEESWRHETAGITYGGVAVGADGTIHVGVADGSVQALGPGGQLRWRFDTNEAVVARPSPSGDVVFVASTNRCLYALTTGG